MSLISRSRAFDLSFIDEGSDFLWGFSINGEAKRNTGSENLLAGTFEIPSHGLASLSHGLGNLDDIVEFDVSIVLDVLLGLSVSTSFFKGINKKG